MGLVTHRSQPANEHTNTVERGGFRQRHGFVSAAASASVAPCPACPALKIARGKKALRLGHEQYKLGLRLGEGSFGTVNQATYQGQEVLVKEFKALTFDHVLFSLSWMGRGVRVGPLSESPAHHPVLGRIHDATP